MIASPSTLQFRRAVVETWIERLIALLDELDGDENMEPYLAGTWPDCPISQIDLEEDDERETDPAEYGIADEGALAEQAPKYDRDLNSALFAV
ncbi:hypothetical protein [Rhizobium sp. AG207R]|uniref:hypothetical protein n=1 Tax=Rhizobium sp. AG207R TaxID=2802287 RepID=UPI0022ABCCFB|nr:hypothetical protein [Rhizobium sp. AG207R]MCZ3380396.1 hypothetical protein [Rhizobium sp. AG207R]